MQIVNYRQEHHPAEIRSAIYPDSQLHLQNAKLKKGRGASWKRSMVELKNEEARERDGRCGREGIAGQGCVFICILGMVLLDACSSYLLPLLLLSLFISLFIDIYYL